MMVEIEESATRIRDPAQTKEQNKRDTETAEGTDSEGEWNAGAKQKTVQTRKSRLNLPISWSNL